MTLVSAPLGLRVALAALFLCVPMAAVEAAVALRAPWWRLPWLEMGSCAAFAGVCWGVIATLALKTHRWAVPLATGASALWFIASVGYASWTRTPALAFFSSLVLLFSAIPAFWLRRELGRSFLDPGLRWYQGYPRPIAGVTCMVALGEFKRDCRVSRLDTEGAFIYSDDQRETAPILSRGKAVEIQFDYRGRVFRCLGTPVSRLSDSFGTGVQFRDLSPDDRKDLGDFIEVLRGEGYVD